MGISEKEHLRRQAHEKHQISHSATWLAAVSGAYFILMACYGQPIGAMVLSGGFCAVATVKAWTKRRKANAYKRKLRGLEREQGAPVA
ncbi:ABC transporter ATP-binding protein [Nissabacter sp. SGAir0207]|uniref:ABC transporter ATP-binding protein n=1 Tax=Nissabacter sp. SGAir0207 TaxID=2126321 RepID=UPI0010CCE11B|nr:ABC transporter ATP-binding protein [Nissabacter sp. SGAir0207]QCR35623.1 hypothetical protein C1N62_05770 [Nissabacter sp. SGAir0207]